MLTINGAEMPSPSEMTVTLEDRGETSAINALGQRVADRMAVKRVVHLTWALLTGGELAAMVVIDSIARLVPGVLHNDESAEI